MKISPEREAGLPECKAVLEVIKIDAPDIPKNSPTILFQPNFSCKKMAAKTDTMMGVAMISNEA